MRTIEDIYGRCKVYDYVDGALLHGMVKNDDGKSLGYFCLFPDDSVVIARTEKMWPEDEEKLEKFCLTWLGL